MTEEQGRRIEADLAVLEQIARKLLQDIQAFTNEVRSSGRLAASQNGPIRMATPPEVPVALHSTPQAASRSEAAPQALKPPSPAPLFKSGAWESTPRTASKRVLGLPEFARVPDHAWISRVPDSLLIVLFLLAITLPSATWLLHWESGQSLGENRVLARPPAFGQDRTEELPAKIDAYFGDYFGFRKQLIHWHSVVERKWLGISSDRVVIGKDRWLFLSEQGILLQDFLGLSPFTPEQLKAWKEYLETRREILARRGVRYLFVIASDKWFIYPEKLPDYIRAKAGRPRLDQLLSFLKTTNSPVDVLDLRYALISAKSQGEVFFHQDAHWNGLGYFAAYQEICKRLQKWFPEIHPQSLGKDYDIRNVSWPGGEWGSLGLPDENLIYASALAFGKGTQTAKEVPVNLPPGILPKLAPEHMPTEMVQPAATHRLLLLHDSYMRTGFADHNEFPFSQHFADSLYVGMFHVSLPALLQLLDYQHPDVVIEEIVQRQIRGTAEHQVAAGPPPPGISQLLKRSDQKSASALDLINSVSGPAGVSSIHLPANKEIGFAGWAIDEPNKTPAGGVDIVIDQVAYAAAYGLDRPDVAAHFKSQTFRSCGYTLSLPPYTLLKGPHVVTVRTISNDRKSYYVDQSLKVTID
jgi:alginate O-acetyltransferase complex protein AlgJ